MEHLHYVVCHSPGYYVMPSRGAVLAAGMTVKTVRVRQLRGTSVWLLLRFRVVVMGTRIFGGTVSVVLRVTCQYVMVKCC